DGTADGTGDPLDRLYPAGDSADDARDRASELFPQQSATDQRAGDPSERRIEPRQEVEDVGAGVDDRQPGVGPEAEALGDVLDGAAELVDDVADVRQVRHGPRGEALSSTTAGPGLELRRDVLGADTEGVEDRAHRRAHGD